MKSLEQLLLECAPGAYAKQLVYSGRSQKKVDDYHKKIVLFVSEELERNCVAVDFSGDEVEIKISENGKTTRVDGLIQANGLTMILQFKFPIRGCRQNKANYRDTIIGQAESGAGANRFVASINVVRSNSPWLWDDGKFKHNEEIFDEKNSFLKEYDVANEKCHTSLLVLDSPAVSFEEEVGRGPKKKLDFEGSDPWCDDLCEFIGYTGNNHKDIFELLKKYDYGFKLSSEMNDRGFGHLSPSAWMRRIVETFKSGKVPQDRSKSNNMIKAFDERVGDVRAEMLRMGNKIDASSESHIKNMQREMISCMTCLALVNDARETND